MCRYSLRVLLLTRGASFDGHSAGQLPGDISVYVKIYTQYRRDAAIFGRQPRLYADIAWLIRVTSHPLYSQPSNSPTSRRPRSSLAELSVMKLQPSNTSHTHARHARGALCVSPPRPPRRSGRGGRSPLHASCQETPAHSPPHARHARRALCTSTHSAAARQPAPPGGG